MIKLSRKRCVYLLIVLIVTAGIILLYHFRGLEPKVPQLTFTEGTYFDFGVVEEGSSIVHSFKFKNTGRGDLRIESVRTSCGCTSAKPANALLGSGESSEIKVHYKGRSVRSRELLKVWVVSNDLKHQPAELTLTGRVHLKAFWYPLSVSFYVSKGGAEEYRDVVILTDEEQGIVNIERVSSDIIRASCFKRKGQNICRIVLCKERPEGNRTEQVYATVVTDKGIICVNIPVFIMVNEP